MGSALSPLFFCLALDPLIRVLNTIPGVIKGRCYMDDNATFFQSNKTVDQIQAAFTRYHPAGLRVKQHKCCSFSTLTWNGKGGASWYRAACEALESGEEGPFLPLGGRYAINKHKLRALSRERDRLLLLSLIIIPCTCGCKTGVIPTHQVSLRQLVKLDKSPWGGKLLQSHMTALGLPMHSPIKHIHPGHDLHILDKEHQRKRRTRGHFVRSELAVMARNKNQRSISDRLGRVNETITPLYQRSAYFTMWILSTSHYASTVFPTVGTPTHFPN